MEKQVAKLDNKPIQQVHIISFDLGCISNDCLSVNNSRN